MFLDKEEEKIISGEAGYIKQKALNIIIKIGETLGAEKLVKIKKVHISGISYKNIGDPGLEFIEKLAENGGKFSCYTSINPAGIDLAMWKEMGLDENFFKKQKKIIDLLVKMGAVPTLSCVPYFINPPKYGEQIAWGESNAVLYANSVIGARTNREGGPLTLFEAISGRAPLIGLRIDELRKPTITVDLRNIDNKKYGLIGYLVGKIVKKDIPYIFNIKFKDKYDLRLFLAAIGTSSSIGLTLIENISPEAHLWKKCIKKLEKIVPDNRDLIEAESEISSEAENYDAIMVGCPHLFVDEIRRIVNIVGNKRFSKRFIMFIPRFIYFREKKLLEELRKRGAEIYRDTCMVVTPLINMNIKKVIVDSAKAAYYLSSEGYIVKVVSTENAVRMALE